MKTQANLVLFPSTYRIINKILWILEATLVYDIRIVKPLKSMFKAKPMSDYMRTIKCQKSKLVLSAKKKKPSSGMLTFVSEGVAQVFGIEPRQGSRIDPDAIRQQIIWVSFIQT